MLSRREVLGGAAVCAVGLSFRPVFASGSNPDQPQTEFDRAAQTAIDAGACPGVALQVARHGQPLLARQYGLANIETGSPLTSGSVFRIGSLTKQFTAALIVKLAQDEKLDLDAPVSRHLRYFAGRPAFSARELLHHTAGLHADESGPACADAARGPRSQIELAQDISAQDQLFDFDPGTAWLYSNANYIVLGAVVEQLTAMPLAEAAARMIFEPLGLDHTAFDRSEAVVPGRADGYTPVEGQPGVYTHAPYLEVSDAGGAGAMRSTADDLCRWHHALFTNRLFPQTQVELMLAPGRLRDGRLSGSNRFSEQDAGYGEVQYGMGLLLSPPSDRHRSVLHYGFINGYSACLETYVDLGLTTAILCNGDVGPQLPFRALRKQVSARWLDATG